MTPILLLNLALLPFMFALVSVLVMRWPVRCCWDEISPWRTLWRLFWSWLFAACGVVCWFCSTCESLAACCCKRVNMVESMSFVRCSCEGCLGGFGTLVSVLFCA
ncbi:hypothetical protein QL285_083503 [Trifolium repens]|nr:hypothetical protein QL285_083503 [Trifolium repens]